VDARDVVMESYNIMPQDAVIHNFTCFVIKVINDVMAEFFEESSVAIHIIMANLSDISLLIALLTLRNILFILKLKYNLKFALH
jgi:hypothetical protein